MTKRSYKCNFILIFIRNSVKKFNFSLYPYTINADINADKNPTIISIGKCTPEKTLEKPMSKDITSKNIPNFLLYIYIITAMDETTAIWSDGKELLGVYLNKRLTCFSDTKGLFS